MFAKKLTSLLIAIILFSLYSNSQCNYSFTYSVNGNTVTFDNTNVTLGSGNGIVWNVDGTQMSNTNDPVLTLTDGAHYVCMTVADFGCMPNPTIQVCDSVYVNIQDPCDYDFSYSVSGNIVTFDNTPNVILGTGNGIVWNVDGTQVSNTNDPVLTLSNGAHYMCMTLWDFGCMPNPTIQVCDSVIVPGAQCFGLPYETAYQIPDSTAAVTIVGSHSNYINMGLMNHNGTAFTNMPIWVCSGGAQFSPAIHFYDFDFNLPAVADITGIEIIHNHGGMNSNTYVIDSIYVMSGGTIIGTAKRDSTSSGSIDTLGGNYDVWSTNLNSVDINANDFGFYLFSTMTGFGGTYGQFDFRAKIYYCSTINPNSINENTIQNFEVYPNPFENELIIQGAYTADDSYTITDINGKEFLIGKINSSLETISTQTLPAGMYIIKIRNSVRKIIKTN